MLPVDVLTAESLAVAVDELAARDADLAAVVGRFGVPPLWSRDPGFATLVHIVLEQQVSLASARAAFDRLQSRLGSVTPAGVLSLSDAELLSVGFSRQKSRYVRELAREVASGRLDLATLDVADDDAARRRLTAITGIGDWTADVYLLMALGRSDVWPVGDRALAAAVQQVKGLATFPDRHELAALGERWRPWRSVAARLCWLDYLGRRDRL